VAREIDADGHHIRIISIDGEDYMSLTDIAKRRSEEPDISVRLWLRNLDTIRFLGIWEGLSNPNFDKDAFGLLTEGAGTNSFSLSPKRWIEGVNARGLISRPGRNGGTYAHSDIALEFASWISPEFRLFVIQDYRRLKQEESERTSLDWKLSREIAKINYRDHTDSIKAKLIPPGLSKKQAGFIYADEADMLNVVVFGMTAKEWKAHNPSRKGNMRDHATHGQLLVLANLEGQNATLIHNGIAQEQRMPILREIAIRQLTSVESVGASTRLKALE